MREPRRASVRVSLLFACLFPVTGFRDIPGMVSASAAAPRSSGLRGCLGGDDY